MPDWIRIPTLSLVLTALLGALPAAASEPDSALYQALGERPGIESMVRDLLHRIVRDERIASQFQGIDVQRFHRNLSDQLCELSGGPCRYEGESMPSAHAGMGITETQFNAVTEHLIRAMESEDVPTWAQNRLLAQLVTLHGDIVDVPREPLRDPSEQAE